MKRLVFALAALWFAALAHAQLREVTQVEGVTEYMLPNGLKVLVHADSSKPTTTVNLIYRVGSRHEGVGETGAAHLLEHLLFKGSRTVGDPKAEMSRRGTRWNGTTSPDRTNYFAQFASRPETLDWMLAWLADAMTGAQLRQEDLATEMTVVRNELERGDSNPASVLSAQIRAAAYQWHPYGRDTIGTRSDVENMPIERLRAFYQRHYRPDNAVLVLGGQFDVAAALRSVEKAFGPIARPATPVLATYTREPVQEGERQVTVRRVGGVNHVAVLYHALPASHPDFAALRVLAVVLTDEGGPLQKALVDTRIASTRGAFAVGPAEPGYFMAALTLPETADAEGATRNAATALARVVETATFTPEAVALARGRLLQGVQAGHRDPESVSLALSESVAAGDWRLLFLTRDWLEAVKFEDVQRVAKTWLVPSNRTTGIFVALKEPGTRAPVATSPDVTALLANYRGRDVSAGAAGEGTLTLEEVEKRLVRSRLMVGGEPGLQLAVLPRQSKDARVTGLLRLRWGTAESVKNQAVLATLLSGMLMQGTTTLDAQQIRQRLLSLDANMRVNAGVGGLTASFEAPAAKLHEVLQFGAELLQQASFPDAAFERMRAAALTSTSVSRSDPSAVAGSALQRTMSTQYVDGDPRAARTPEQTEALLRAATPEQLRAFWRRFAGAAHGELVIDGPVDPGGVLASAQQAFGGWKSAEPHRPWNFEYPVLKGKWESLVVPDKANATYTARLPVAINEEAPDYPALLAGVHLLGGSATSALWQRVREKEGLSYGVGATLLAQTRGEGQSGAISFNASFAPQNRDRLRDAIHDEVRQRLKQRFSEEEVAQARGALLQSRANALAQPATIAGIVAGNLRWGRDTSWQLQQQRAVQELDAAAVNAALARHVDLDRLTEFAAGSFAQ